MQNVNIGTGEVNVIDDIIDDVTISISQEQTYNWAKKKFFEEIDKALKSAEEYGWLTQEDVERKLGYGVND